ncbi:MAG: TIM-barrel domain-containing protein [Nitriliruptoraceae bacterium]
MIRHHPEGRGHAYRPSLDQRIPATPEADLPVELRALVSPESRHVVVEVTVDGRDSTHELHPFEEEGAATLQDGHLAAAAAAGEHTGGLLPWTVTIGPFPPECRVTYRFRDLDDDVTTETFSFTPAVWRRSPDAVHVNGDAGYRLVSESIVCLRGDTGAHRVRFALRLEPDEHVVGLGERFHALDQRGWAVDTVVFEQYRDQHTRTYLPVPFALIVGGDGWGFHVDTTRRCWFDVGASDPNLLLVEVATDPRADEATVDLGTWSGRPNEVLGGFLDVVGRPALAPDWVYRPWASGNEWNTQQRVEAEIGRSVAEGIPLGVVVIEAWSDETSFLSFRDAVAEPIPATERPRLDDYTFPPDGAWPDPVGMVERLHEQGVRVLLWQIPVIPDHVNDPQLDVDRQALVERGYAVRESDGSPYRNRGWWFPGGLLPDFTSPEVRTWWTERRRYLLEDLGVDGFKTDGGEHAWGDDLRYLDGTRGDVSNNRFANLYPQAYHELIARTGSDAITFSRAGFTGAGSYPCHWAGDEASTWEAYRASIVAGLTAGASGIFLWGWDHGGFSGEIPDAELYLRTAAMACFCPIMQYHAEFNHHRVPSRDRTPWNIAERHDRPDVLDIYRRFAVLRDRLVDELRTQAAGSAASATPLMRALFFEWPDDPVIWQHTHQYLLGDDLLVAPVTEPDADTWSIYVPGDTWIDPWTGDSFTGPALIEVDAPLDRIPVLVREGADRLLPIFVGLPD